MSILFFGSGMARLIPHPSCLFALFVVTHSYSFPDSVCYQSSEGGNEVPGCSGQTSGGIDYCFTPTLHTGNLPLTFIGDELSAYGECQGDCDSDSEVSLCIFLSRYLIVSCTSYEA